MSQNMEPVWQNLPGLITVYVGGVQVAGAVDVHHGHTDKQPQWQVLSTMRFKGAANPVESVQCRNEEHARDWLLWLTKLYSQQPGAYSITAAAA